MLPLLQRVYCRIILLFIALTTLPSCVLASDVCKIRQAQAAETSIENIHSWEDLYNYFQLYAACDDGAIAEGVSDSVTLLLANQWQSLHKLYVQSEKTPLFRTFVMRHIDDTAPQERLVTIAQNAEKKCLSNLKKLCRDIEKSAKRSAKSAGSP